MDTSDCSNDGAGNDKPNAHPKFSIKPAGNSSNNLSEWLDLNDIFLGK